MGQVSVTTEGATRRVTMSQVYVTGLACAMASVRQMSQVWHVMRQMSQVWHVSRRLCVRCHGVRASDVMSRNVKTAAAGDVSPTLFIKSKFVPRTFSLDSCVLDMLRF